MTQPKQKQMDVKIHNQIFQFHYDYTFICRSLKGFVVLKHKTFIKTQNHFGYSIFKVAFNQNTKP